MTVANLCPDCGAHNLTGVTRCWLCGAALGETASSEDTPVVAELVPEAARQSAKSFQLNSLMLLVTLICVCLGMVTFAPGLVGLLLFVAAPAYIMTVRHTRQREAAGEALTTWQRVEAFALRALLSAAMVLSVISLLAFAAFAALFVMCIYVLSQSAGKF